MNNVAPILPIEGVPEELLRVLNDRFRQVQTPPAVTASPTGQTVQVITQEAQPAGMTFTHATRASFNLSSLGTFGFETDRSVTYQVQSIGSSKVWVYTSGTMIALFADRPTDLGVYDTGFLFIASDTLAGSRWDGAAWVDLVGGIDNEAQLAYCSSALTLGTSFADITGATLTLAQAGRYLITAHVEFSIADIGVLMTAELVVDGTSQSQQIRAQATGFTTITTGSQQWLYTPGSAGKVVKLRAKKASGAGASTVTTPDTSISALWIGA